MLRAFRFVYTALFLAIDAVRKNGLRSVLTALGILIGVAAVTITVALGEGATKAVSGTIDSLGENAYTVIPRETAKSGAKGEKLPPLTEKDGRALVREAGDIVSAAPVLNGFSQLSWRDNNTSAQVVGTSRAFLKIRAWELEDGRLWAPEAETLGAKQCIVGETLREELFEGEDPIGRVIRIGRHPFRVVGLLKAKGQSPFGQDQDNVLIMPTATMRAKLTPTPPGHVHRILFSAKKGSNPERVKDDARAILRQQHKLAENAENDFRVRSQEEFRQMQQAIFGVLQMLLLSVAAVSLLVGGIGVMNIMLVSVAERTREIGIRMAIGAREVDILVQFLVEAIVLSLLGGAAGALLAALAVGALASALDWPMGVSPQALGVALGVSTAVGVVFGFIPARRAAQLDPIQALRRE